MSDDFEAAFDAAKADAQKRSDHYKGQMQARRERADALAQKAADAIVASLSGYESLPGTPGVNVEPRDQYNETVPGESRRSVSVKVAGPKFEVDAFVMVSWHDDLGPASIGGGQSGPVRFKIHDRTGSGMMREFTYDVGIGPVHQGHFAVDRDTVAHRIKETLAGFFTHSSA